MTRLYLTGAFARAEKPELGGTVGGSDDELGISSEGNPNGARQVQ